MNNLKFRYRQALDNWAPTRRYPMMAYIPRALWSEFIETEKYHRPSIKRVALNSFAPPRDSYIGCPGWPVVSSIYVRRWGEYVRSVSAVFQLHGADFIGRWSMPLAFYEALPRAQMRWCDLCHKFYAGREADLEHFVVKHL